MKSRRVLMNGAIVFSILVLFSGQACPPNGDDMMPGPDPIPGPAGPPGPAGSDATVTQGDGVIVDNGVVSLDIGFTDALYWKQGGNAGTTAGTHFLGTTDAEPVEIHVNGERAFRLEPTADGPNVIAGASANQAVADVIAGTIAGGGPTDPADATTGNQVSDNFCAIGGGGNNRAGTDDGDTSAQDYATVGGGLNNKADMRRSTIAGGANNDATGDRATISGGEFNNADRYATVGGGQVNSATGFSSTVGGGTSNVAMGEYATVAGGQGNEAAADLTAIGGGRDNRAQALLAMVPGGFQCHANGFASFAAGYNARAEHDGAFVWTDTDGIPVPFSSTGEDQFLIRAAGGVGIGTNAPAGALHTQAPDDDTPDLVVGGTDGDDNGLIASDPTLPSSDINFFSNGDLGFKLDSNDDETNAQFIVADGDEFPVFVVGESGKASAGSFEAEDNLGSSDTPDAGRVYRDNVVYAWAHVQSDGTVTASYGCTVTNVLGLGNYRVNFKRQLPNGVSAVVTPQTVNDPVIATVVTNQNQADVAIKSFNGTTFVAADYGFYIQVVGRP